MRPIPPLFFALAMGGATAVTATDVAAQTGADSGTVTVRVRRDSTPASPSVEAAIVRSGTIGGRTDATGAVTLRLAAGPHTIVASRLGFRPDSVALVVRGGTDTTVALVLREQAVESDVILVTATRAERRVEDTPLRVETIDAEEIAEKVAMSPGDIAMMLNETSGLRVQATNPSLGGANVRVQGLRGRYALILADGLPLHGGQAGGLGLLQIPPVDLGRVEIIKGTASALYGASALGGVIDLVSRRPGESAERTALVNRTSRGGTDAVFFGATGDRGGRGLTLLTGVHDQRRVDIDRDGWTDMPGYSRVVVRPRLYAGDGERRDAFLTGGFTAEDRRGGTLPGAVTPEGTPYEESLRTRRADIGGLARLRADEDGRLLGVPGLDGGVLTLRGSAVEQRHAHRFGPTREDDRHRTVFGEASLATVRERGGFVVGGAYQEDRYRNAELARFDYAYRAPALFAQGDLTPREWLALSVSARGDFHNVFGTLASRRASLLLRTPDGAPLPGWSTRLSLGDGAYAPTPFIEETEVIGLTPIETPQGLRAERATSGSIDVGGPILLPVGAVEINATLFGSRVQDPLQLVSEGAAGTPGRVVQRLRNAGAPTRTWGGELLLRLTRSLGDDGADAADGDEAEGAEESEAPSLRVTASYTYLRSTECSASGARIPFTGSGSAVGCERVDVALTPRHAAGIVASIEQEGVSRVGLELYYTGRQRLERNPFRVESRPYLIVGLLAERAFVTRVGTPRLFVNLENLTNVRQTRFDPLRLPARTDGRWTTDAWTDLSGFTANGGIRWSW